MTTEHQPTPFVLDEQATLDFISFISSSTDNDELFENKLLLEFLTHKTVDNTYGGNIQIGRLINTFFDLVQAHLMFKANNGPLLLRSVSSTLILRFEALKEAVSQLPPENSVLDTFLDKYNSNLPSQLITHQGLREDLRHLDEWILDRPNISTNQV